MLSGELTDVSDALDRLLATVVGVAARGVLQKDPDEIRRTAFYTEPACTALKLVDGTLKRCFGKLAALDVPPPSSPPPPKAPSNSASRSGSGGGGGGDLPMLSVDEWLHAVREFRIAGPDLSERVALQAWAWSRMMVEHGATIRGQRREHALPYEGFLELVCHLACLKGLPDDDEIADAGCTDAGDFLLRAEEDDPLAFDRLIQQRAAPWALDPPPDLPRRIEHMSSVLHAHLFRGLGQKASKPSSPLNGPGSKGGGASSRGAGKIKEAGDKIVAMNAGVGAMKVRKASAVGEN